MIYSTIVAKATSRAAGLQAMDDISRFSANPRGGTAFASEVSFSFKLTIMNTVEKPVFRNISACDAASLIRSEPPAIVFDVRDMASYQAGHVDGAAHLSEDRLMAWMKRLPKDAPVIIYCYKGNASKVYAQMFVDFRYTSVFSVDGGYEPLAVALASPVTA